MYQLNHYSNKRCYENSVILEGIVNQLRSRNFIEVQTDNPDNYRKRVGIQARRRGIPLRFATCDNSVIIYMQKG